MSGGLFVAALSREVETDLDRYAKPDADLLLTAAGRIEVDVRDSIVVDDSVWDLLAHLDEVGWRRPL